MMTQETQARLSVLFLEAELMEHWSGSPGDRDQGVGYELTTYPGLTQAQASNIVGSSVRLRFADEPGSFFVECCGEDGERHYLMVEFVLRVRTDAGVVNVESTPAEHALWDNRPRIVLAGLCVESGYDQGEPETDICDVSPKEFVSEVPWGLRVVFLVGVAFGLGLGGMMLHRLVTVASTANPFFIFVLLVGTVGTLLYTSWVFLVHLSGFWRDTRAIEVDWKSLWKAAFCTGGSLFLTVNFLEKFLSVLFQDVGQMSFGGFFLTILQATVVFTSVFYLGMYSIRWLIEQGTDIWLGDKAPRVEV